MCVRNMCVFRVCASRACVCRVCVPRFASCVRASGVCVCARVLLVASSV